MTLRKVCAWCGVVIEENPAATATSHGICEACVPKFLADIEPAHV